MSPTAARSEPKGRRAETGSACARDHGDAPLNRLIVTADDFGLAPEVNEAVEQAHRSGILTAASLMVAAPAAADAVRRARAMPQLHVGLHLVLLEGRPALDLEHIPELTGTDGNLRSDMVRLAFELAASREVRRELLSEIAAQFELFQRTGLALDHVDAHKHFQLHPIVFGMIAAVGRQYGMRGMRVPVEPRPSGLSPSGPGGGHFLRWWGSLIRARARANGLQVPDAVYGLAWSGAMTQPRILSLLRSLPEGIVEIYTHPATRDEFCGHAARYRYTDELAALCHPEVRSALRLSRHLPGGYSDCQP
jgi:hopanoid biosynthesis associated protein HpnK